MKFSMGRCSALGCRTLVKALAQTAGVLQNRLLLAGLSHRLEAARLSVLRSSRYPANDGGIALGQAAVAVARMLSTDQVA